MTDRIRVVLADDTADLRLLLRMALEEDQRFDVVGEAANGEDAVELAAREQPDAIVLDLAMPVMDGLEAIPAIRTSTPRTKIVVLSGFDAEEMSAQVLARGAHLYLEKGVALREIAFILATLCDSPFVTSARDEAAAAADDAEIREAHVREIVSLLWHEVSTPVTVLDYCIQRLRMGTEHVATADVATTLDVMSRNVEHIGELTRSLMDAHAGGIKLHRSDVSIDELVETVVADMAPILAPHPTHVRVTSVTAPVDGARVRQIVTNLLSNAAKYSPATAAIDVSVTATDSDVEISVADRGPGVREEDRGRLFAKFSRVDSGIRTTGLGLGLYLSRAIARAHGGDVTAAFPSEGGARFALTLPLQVPLARDSSEAATARA